MTLQELRGKTVASVFTVLLDDGDISELKVTFTDGTTLEIGAGATGMSDRWLDVFVQGAQTRK